MGMFGSGAKSGAKSDPSQLSGSDRMMMAGAMMRDVGSSLRGGDGDSVAAMHQLLAERQQKAARDAWMAQAPPGLIGGQAAASQGGFMPKSNLPPMNPPMGSTPIVPQFPDPQGAMATGLDNVANGAPPPPPEPAGPPSLQSALPWIMQGIQMGDPRAAAMASILHEAQPGAPKVVEGPDGIYREDGKGGFTKVQPYAPAVPFGWEVGPDGNPRPRTGGPADPAYIARTAGVKRDAVVSRPMPSQARPKAVNPNAIKWD